MRSEGVGQCSYVGAAAGCEARGAVAHLDVAATPWAEPEIRVEGGRGVNVRPREPKLGRDRIDVRGRNPPALGLCLAKALQDLAAAPPEAALQLGDGLSWDGRLPVRGRLLVRSLVPDRHPRGSNSQRLVVIRLARTFNRLLAARAASTSSVDGESALRDFRGLLEPPALLSVLLAVMPTT